MTPIKHAVLVLALAAVIAALIVRSGLDLVDVQDVGDCPHASPPS